MNNKYRTDREVLGWISDELCDRYSWISEVSYPEFEDYKLDLTMTTSYGEVKAEVKTSRSHEIMMGSEFNPYFSTSNPNGILRYSEPLKELPQDKHVYMINASTRINGKAVEMDSRCKLQELIKNQAVLIYISKGGYLIWDYEALGKSFLGYAWTKCYHTEDFRKDNKQERELKALFAFEGAKYIKTTTIFS